MADVFEVPDIPIPPEQEKVENKFEDEFEAAFKFAFIGTGQAGSRLAEAFYKLGYRKVAVINTTSQDLTLIDIPEENKLAICEGGAGKDPSMAKEVAVKKREDILDHMRRCFGEDVDRIFICASAGGGTGSGTTTTLVEIAGELMESLSKEKHVGAVVALPANSEGRKPMGNAVKLLDDMFELVEKKVVSPLVIIDNEKIKSLYPGLAVDKFWSTANMSIASLVHLFNSIAIQDSGYATFDSSDFKGVLDSGVVALGAAAIAKYDNKTELSQAVRDNLAKNVLVSGLDISQGSIAGCIFIAGENQLKTIPLEDLQYGFEMLARRLKGGEGTVHQGIYKGNKDSLVVYTIIGGLGIPQERFREMHKFAGFKDWDEV